MTIWYLSIARWITKGTNTHSEYVILTAFPLQQWLHEHASMLRHMYIDCRFYVKAGGIQQEPLHLKISIYFMDKMWWKF